MISLTTTIRATTTVIRTAATFASRPSLRHGRVSLSTSTASTNNIGIKPPQHMVDPSKVDASATTQFSRVWFQGKRMPLYVTVLGTLGFAGYVAHMRSNVHGVQTDPKIRQDVVPYPKSRAPSHPESIQMVSSVASATTTEGGGVNPQGLGVDAKEWQNAKEAYRRPTKKGQPTS